jgi:hypothetical protein
MEMIVWEQLPASARRHAAWWFNCTRNMYSRIWLGAGFRAQAALGPRRPGRNQVDTFSVSFSRTNA